HFRRYTKNLRLELGSRDFHRGILCNDWIARRRFCRERGDSERCDGGKRAPPFGVAMTHQKNLCDALKDHQKRRSPAPWGFAMLDDSALDGQVPAGFVKSIDRLHASPVEQVWVPYWLKFLRFR